MYVPSPSGGYIYPYPLGLLRTKYNQTWPIVIKKHGGGGEIFWWNSIQLYILLAAMPLEASKKKGWVRVVEPALLSIFS